MKIYLLAYRKTSSQVVQYRVYNGGRFSVKTISTIAAILCLALAAALCACYVSPKEEFDPYATFHNHIWGDVLPEYGKAPTCVETGLGFRNCTLCDEYEHDIVMPIDPQAHLWGMRSEKTIIPKTCTTAGVGIQYCGRNYGKVNECKGEREVTGPVSGHERRIVPLTATCISAGKGVERCVNSWCVDPEPGEEVDVPALGHDLATKREEPNCTKTGKETTGCFREGCEEPNFQEEVLPLTGHYYSTEIILPPTCLTAGFGSEKCRGCGLSGGSGRIEPLGHNWVNLRVGMRCNRCLVYTILQY